MLSRGSCSGGRNVINSLNSGKARRMPLIRISDRIDAILTGIGRIAAWAALGVGIVTIFDVLARPFFNVGSAALQEIEWHFHVVLFTLCLGYAYVKNVHVRIDVFSKRFGRRSVAWIELIGCLLLLLPFAAVVLFYSVDFVWEAFIIGESSSSPMGLGQRWLIKSFLPLGIALLALSAVAVSLRNVAVLMDKTEPKQETPPPGTSRETHKES